MRSVYRISVAQSCPTITILDKSVEDPQRWISGGDLPQDVVRATIDRQPRALEFCRLIPGALVLPESALFPESGPNDMYYPLWWETQRVDLDVDGRPFMCLIPNLSLDPDVDLKSSTPPGGVPASVFRIKGRNPAEIFCVSGIFPGGGGDEFELIYKAEGFEGITYELVWTESSSWDLTSLELL